MNDNPLPRKSNEQLEIDDTELLSWAVTDKYGLEDFVRGIKKGLLFERIPQKTLFHYTDAYGLKGILDSGELWLTEIRYFNDSLELNYAHDLIAGILRSRYEKTNDFHDYYEYLTNAFNPFENHFYAFVACFSEALLLNQFRNYGNYSIGLCTKNRIRCKFNLSRPAPWQPAIFRKVIYDRAEQEQIVNELLSRIELRFQQVVDEEDIRSGWPRQELIQDFGLVVNSLFVECLLSFKHQAFVEEQEWRMIYTEIKDVGRRKVDFRVRSDHFVPYVAMPLCRVNDDELKDHIDHLEREHGFVTEENYINYIETKRSLPINGVHIGPIDHKELVKDSIKQFLSLKHNLQIPINLSDVHLRQGW